MDIKLIAIDIDGTLLHDDKSVSDENRQAIIEAREAGVQVVLCTGRPLRSMTYLLDELDLRNDDDIVITYNGGLIQNAKTGDVINQITFNREECLDIYDLSQSLGMPITFIDLDYVYLPPHPEGAESLYTGGVKKSQVKDPLKFINITIDELPEKLSVNAMIMSRPADELDAIIPQIPANYHEKYNIYKSRDTMLEFLPKDVDKGFSMRLIGKMLGLEKRQIMGLGDQENDLSLIQNAGIGVAMDNAIDIVKESADYITKSNNDHGVAHAILKFVLNK